MTDLVKIPEACITDFGYSGTPEVDNYDKFEKIRSKCIDRLVNCKGDETEVWVEPSQLEIVENAKLLDTRSDYFSVPKKELKGEWCVKRSASTHLLSGNADEPTDPVRYANRMLKDLPVGVIVNGRFLLPQGIMHLDMGDIEYMGMVRTFIMNNTRIRFYKFKVRFNVTIKSIKLPTCV